MPLLWNHVLVFVFLVVLVFFLKVTKSSCRSRLKENQNISRCDHLILEELKSITSKNITSMKNYGKCAVSCYPQTTSLKITDL